jgi:signal transduction histidine kinase
LTRGKTKTEVLTNASKKSLLKIPYFVLTISLIVTMSVTFFYYSSAKTIDAQRFESRANKIKSEIENRIDTYIALLRAGRGFFYASEGVNKEEFARFVGNFDLRGQYPGVLAIGFSKVFTADEKNTLIKKDEKLNIPALTLKPKNPRDQHQAIIYIEPFDDRNKVALGFDMSSEPIRRQALETARDSGRFVTSGKVVLVQERGTNELQAGFLIYLPVYKSKNIPETVEERRQQIDGFIYSPFRAGDFVKDLIKEGEIDEVSFRIYDYELNEDSLLAVGNEELGVKDSVLKGENEVEFGSRKWVITYTPTEKFRAQSLVWWTPIIFFLGIAISVVLFFLSLSQSRINRRMVKTAQDLAVSGAMVQTLLESEKEARQKAEQATRVKDEFLATVSHELRTPLNAISGWINILNLRSADDELRKKAIVSINRNLHAQANLVEQILIFSDNSALFDLQKRRKFSVADLLTEYLGFLEEKISKKNLKLVRNLSEVEIIGDREKIKLAIGCILENAVKFTPNGGTITVDLHSKNNKCLLEITDNGEGISQEMLPHIFETFSQSDTSTVRKHSGLGLGLAIARKIIESHSGTISVESQGLQQGSKFTIILPS